MIIRIYNTKNEEIKEVPIDLDQISPLFYPKTQNLEKIDDIKSLQEFLQEIRENREKIEHDSDEYLPINLSDEDNETSIEIPFEVFISELIDTIDMLVQIYWDKGVRIEIGD